MNRLELLYGYQKTESGLKVYADMHHVNQNTMTRWIRQFLLHGLAGVRHRSFNHRCSLIPRLKPSKSIKPVSQVKKSLKSMIFVASLN
ncbi:hypothetical protein PO252_02145 [Limosilactobacillus mucosae]|uniref:hypothetical protein n=1 Tax=Limosilactobacillus mucosae TaxID=97478 RepID=UPI00233F67D9|nr:hypothetical protein [Limosilactobacillus mucosae]MDC2838656.1 hypothetical protein [Limosilactobacillus mucosae]